MTITLTDEQEIILYRMAIRQDEQGRQSNLMLETKLQESPVFRELLDEQYVVYRIEGGSGKTAIARLIVSDKGMRYCYENLNRMSTLDRNSRPQF